MSRLIPIRIATIFKISCLITLGDSQNYMLAILVAYSAKRITSQVLAIAKLSGRDIISPSKELPVQS